MQQQQCQSDLTDIAHEKDGEMRHHDHGEEIMQLLLQLELDWTIKAFLGEE